MTDEIVKFDADYYAWTREQSGFLRNLGGLVFELPIDTRNLADEVAGLGEAEKRRLNESLEAIVLNLVKLEYGAGRPPRKNWRNAVAVERKRAQRILRASPSLFAIADIEEAFQSVCPVVAAELAREGGFDGALPLHVPYTMNQLLNDSFWPANRKGISD